MIDKAGIINKAIDFPMDVVVERYARDEELPMAVAREHEREIKRFLALCALNPGLSYGMRGPIDNLWHTFLVFTRDYAQFCDRVGGKFIHHVPEVPEKMVPVGDGQADTYGKFLQDYKTAFGEEAPAHLWPRKRLGGAEAKGADHGCSGCNTCHNNCNACGVNHCDHNVCSA